MSTALRKLLIKKEKKFIDKSVMAVAIFYPFTTVPQIVDIFTTHKTEGISVLTWILYLVFSFFFLLYSIRKNLKPLIIEYILWIVMEGAVVAGALIY